MIKSFRHKGLRRFFETGDISGINPHFAAKLRRQFIVLNASDAPSGMNMPGYRLHPLSGDRGGQWAVWVSCNWRLIFAFEGSSAIDIDLVDYH
jgi:proteic killer suppression protein